MKKRKKSSVIIITIMVIIGVAIITAFYYLGNRMNPSESTLVNKENETEIDKILAKDFETAYPSTPREVLKLYSRIVVNFYNEKATDDEIEKLAKKVILLFDEELLDNNPMDQYLEDLKKEILEYSKAKKSIISYDIEKSSSVKYYSKNNKEYASIVVSYMLKKDSEYGKTYEEFVLRKDSKGNWKILGWEVTSAKDIE